MVLPESQGDDFAITPAILAKGDVCGYPTCVVCYMCGRPKGTYIYIYIFLDVYMNMYVFFLLCSVRSDCAPMVLSPWFKGGSPQPVATEARGLREHLLATDGVGGSVKGCKDTPKTKTRTKNITISLNRNTQAKRLPAS